MAVTLTLYKNSSDNFSVDKYLTEPITFNAELKLPTEVEEPTFTIHRGEHGYLTGYNYLYCPELGRYYFAHITILAGGMASITCEVDALSSFKSGIRALSGVIERQEFIYNPYLEDSGISIAQGSIIRTKKVVGTVGDNAYHHYVTCAGAVSIDPDP